MAYTAAQKKAWWAKKKAGNQTTDVPAPSQKKEVRRLANPSIQQTAIFSEVASGQGNLVIQARAGSGKTTALVEATFYVPAGKTIAAVAFNKKIAHELKDRLPDAVESGTCHSFGYRAVRRRFKVGAPDNYKVPNIIRSLIGDESEKAELVDQLDQTVKFCKLLLVSITDSEQVHQITDEYGIETEHEYLGFSSDAFVIMALEVHKLSAERTDVIDFNDMLFFPWYHKIKMDQFDCVFGDESQDWNKAQRELVKNMVKPNGRLICFLDPRQAIYSWAGADARAVQLLIEETKSKVLPLSITYRCPKSVVKLIHDNIPGLEDFQAHETAPEGSVQDCGFEDMINGAGPGDFILSRANAPLMGIAMRFLKEGRGCNIQGRDIGTSFLAFIRRSKAKDMDKFITYLENWRARETERVNKKKNKSEKAIETIEDRYDCFHALASGCNNLDDMRRKIEGMFSDNDEGNIITLSSVHRGKGHERKRVWILMPTLKAGKSEEEDNIYYVGMTRTHAKHDDPNSGKLFLVQSLKSEQEG